jgi:hypothetical protein
MLDILYLRRSQQPSSSRKGNALEVLRRHERVEEVAEVFALQRHDLAAGARNV